MVPQISVIVGPSAGGAVYSPAITDFIFMVKDIGQMYITGPDVVKSVTGEEISHQDLGGSEAHSSKSGVAHFVYDSEEECMNGIKRLLSFIPQNNLENAEKKDFSENTTNEELRNIIPEKSTEAYDVKDVINKDYHFSYPSIFKLGKKIFMFPETAEKKRVELWVCTGVAIIFIFYKKYIILK